MEGPGPQEVMRGISHHDDSLWFRKRKEQLSEKTSGLAKEDMVSGRGKLFCGASDAPAD